MIAQADKFLADKPELQRFLERFEFQLRRLLTWRAGADLQQELRQLSTLFGKLALLFTVVFVVVNRAGATTLATDSAYMATLCGFAWTSFRWTFRHREVMAPIWIKFGYALAIPWGVLGLDVAANANAVGEFVTILPWQAAHAWPSAAVATSVSLVVAGIAACAYVLYWLLLSPFPYLMLGLLAGTRYLSANILRRYGRHLLVNVTFVLAILDAVYSHLKG